MHWRIVMKKIVVIGAGPAGMMAAITAAKNKNQVILLDGNEKVGKKMQEVLYQFWIHLFNSRRLKNIQLGGPMFELEEI